MGQQWLVAEGAVISARGVERRKLGRKLSFSFFRQS